MGSDSHEENERYSNIEERTTGPVIPLLSMTAAQQGRTQYIHADTYDYRKHSLVTTVSYDTAYIIRLR